MVAKKTGGFIVMLESSAKAPPSLLTRARKAKDESGKDKPGIFIVEIVHPNTKEAIYSQEHKCKDIYEALALANQLKEKPEYKNVQTVYQEILHIPQPRKGSMKLNSLDDDEPKKKRGRPAKPKTEEKPKVKAEKKAKEAKVSKSKAKPVKAAKKAKPAKKASKSAKKPKKLDKKKKNKKK